MFTEQAKYGLEIVSKIKKHLEQGGNVIITALEGKGIEQIAELHVTGDVLTMDQFWEGFGTRPIAAAGVRVPEVAFQTNDAWPIVRGISNGGGAAAPIHGQVFPWCRCYSARHAHDLAPQTRGSQRTSET